MWNALIINPFVNTLIWFYGLLGNNYGLAILVLTVLIRLILLPLTWQQQKAALAMQEAQPKLKELQEKYKNDPETLQRKTMEFYREQGVNPLGGCLPTLIQFPILIGFYRAITLSLAASPLQLIDLSQHIYKSLPAFLSWLPDATALIPLKSKFLWLNLATPDPIFVLPVLVVATTWLQQKLLTPPSANPDPQQAAMNQSMQIMMPLMIGWFSLSFPSGLSIYWIASNIAGLVQYAAMGRLSWDSFKNLFSPLQAQRRSEGRSSGRSGKKKRV